MPLYSGVKPVQKVYIGSKEVQRVYLNGSKVYQKAVAPTDGPYTAYNFEETGSQFLDASGNGHHATIIPATNRTESFAKNGTHAAKQGAVIAGGTSGVAVAGYNAMSSRTVAGWVSYYLLTGTWLMRWQSTTVDSGVYGLYYATGAIISRVKKGGTNYQATYSMNPVQNQWYHIAQTYDAVTGENKLYVDGVLRSTATVPGGGTPDAADFIDLAGDGATPGGSTASGAAIDDWRTWPRALTAAEITAAMNTPV